MWPTGGAWLCLHLWDHYEFTGDRAYLARDLSADERRRRVLPRHAGRGAGAQAGSSRSPSLSPENPHPPAPSLVRWARRWTVRFCAICSPTLIEAAQTLGTDADFRSEVARRRASGSRRSDRQRRPAARMARRLGHAGAGDASPPRVAPLRSVSRARRSTLRRTPELAAAVQTSLEIRGDQATGWAIAWRINLWARLGDGERTH